ncbi:FTM protein, partial [Atrichornis clamosus]|nr:FTM protein [Atrichornis clamosus]
KVLSKVTSLGFTKSQITPDETIQQLCVEYRLNNFFAEDTPLSLPKPTSGQRIHCNSSTGEYDVFLSKCVPSLKFCLIKFFHNMLIPVYTSDAPEDEQDLECEDTAFALVHLKEIFQKQRNTIEQDID